MHASKARRAAPLVLGVALAAPPIAPLGAQEPPTTPQPVAPYRAPVIALVQPPPGGSIPRDKPFLVFRFAPGEPGDPIDVRSFAITVDGLDRTASFQVTATDAWGTLREPELGALSRESAPATHAVAARICSARGACASVMASVPVAASPAVAASEPVTAREGWLDLLLRAARRLLIP